MRSHNRTKKGGGEGKMELPEQPRVDEEEQAPPLSTKTKESQPQQQQEPQRDAAARKYVMYCLLFVVIATGLVLGLYFGGVFSKEEEETVQNFGKSRFDTEPPSESPTSSPTRVATPSPTMSPAPTVMPVPVTPNPTAEGEVYCSDARCGFGFNDAMNKCGASCLVWDDVACGEGENCFYGLTKDLDCCITMNPTSDPTGAPTSFGETPAPTGPPGTCGMGNVGNGICPIPAECCSEFGWCGTTEEFCSTSSPTVTTTERPSLRPTTAPVADTSSPTSSPTTSSPTSANTESNRSPVTVAEGPPCGDGNVGIGICADPTHCCSEFGWCGTAEEYCAASPPTTTPAPTLTRMPTTSPSSSATTQQPTFANSTLAPTTTPSSFPTAITLPVDDTQSRLIAYLGNWQSCPTRDQWQYYTHIVISFAVSYTWAEYQNDCSETCEIATPPVCENAPNPELIQEWKDAGKKVLLSFGGAGMGGSWSGDVNNCWDYCFGRETQVVERLVEIVAEMGLDGIDLDYEYFVEPNENNRDFNLTSEAEVFLADVTTGLRQSLPGGSIVTHAPLDNELVQGTAYYNILKAHASSLDFLMPQYYNGIVRPLADFMSAPLAHYTNLVDDVFGGDPTKIVFGFCIEDCSATSSNTDGNQAALIMNLLQVTYPCNGGAFLWVAEHDYGGEWSRSITQSILQNDCPV